jgi:hypothetical protein
MSNNQKLPHTKSNVHVILLSVLVVAILIGLPVLVAKVIVLLSSLSTSLLAKIIVLLLAFLCNE